ncbi:hypothetical protein [Elizabethkingia anophelis]|uniref:hypothetical protein n=1 Tax=Elizabethkingia anophelis TaxID=1117645 RepID=UPI00040FB566|nr:hypothetical protein [Elizabethkingia anophelis]
MKNTLKSLIENSGKKTKVVFEGKDRRKNFDESFAQKKMYVISQVIGDNSKEIANRISSK